MMNRRKKVSLESVFRSLSGDVRNALSAEDSALYLGLAALAIGSQKCGIDFLSADEIVGALEHAGVAVDTQRLRNAFSRAGSRVSRRKVDGATEYKVMTAGIEEVQHLTGHGNLELVHIEAGKPRTARLRLADVVADLDGTIRVSDPYFGETTLDALETIPKDCEVRFLTAKLTGNEARLKRLTADLTTERPNVVVKIYPNPAELHDRYLHSDKRLIIVGHGLKDIGKKESFVIAIDHIHAPELLQNVKATFDVRWASSATF